MTGFANNFLPDGKLQLLVERYAGCSIQLPAHGEEEIYGSLSVYRREVLEELAAYQKAHPKEAILKRLRDMARIKPELAEAASACLSALE